MPGAIWMAVNATTKCNRDCEFCFNKLAGRKKEDMLPDTCDRLLDCFERHIGRYGHSRNTEIEIIGGEPLTVPEITEHLAVNFKKISPVAQVKVSTNTHLFNEKWAKWFKENDIIMCFSINDNSLDHIADKLSLARKYKVKLFPFFALTPTNLYRLEVLLDMFQGEQIFMIHEFGRATQEYIDLFAKRVPEALQWAVDNNLNLNPERLYEAMSVNRPEGFNPTYGGLSARVFVIETDGRVGKYFYKDITVGNIWDDEFDFIESINSNMDRLMCEYGYKSVKTCIDCGMVGVCGGGGGCQMRKVDTLSEDSPPSLCNTHKRVIPLLMQLKNKWKGPAFGYDHTAN